MFRYLLLAIIALSLKIGVGKGDITGTIGEIDMMGYAHLGQAANGIHLRLYARAFIYGNEKQRVVYVSCNLGQISNFVKQRVIKLLAMPDTYTEENVMISAEHTHSGPSGYLDNFLYVANVFGVVPNQREPIVQGIVQAVKMAHSDFESSRDLQLTVHQGKVEDTSVNRSPSSYMENPAEERANYDSNVDKIMTILATRDKGGELQNFVSWFPVHAVSMNSSFNYVSGDNKGFAAHYWEANEKPGFVAAFSSSNAGDVSPNIKGPRCQDSGLPCDGGKTSCPDGKGKFRISMCVSEGPGERNNNFANTKLIGTRQAVAAKSILAGESMLISDDSVSSRHVWIDMTNVTVIRDGKIYKTCKPAMGASFSAGTTDGPGVDGAYQGLGDGNKLLDFLSPILSVILSPGENLPAASKELEKCHEPKSILLATGEYNVPYPWQPSVLPLQIFIIGRKLAIIGHPSEITTMAGRRLQEAVFRQLRADGSIDDDGRIVISSLSNHYASYVTTYEEYLAQRYLKGLIGMKEDQPFTDPTLCKHSLTILFN
jgi:neutral ceramidase